MVMPTPRNGYNHAGVIKDFEDNGYVTWATHADGCNYGDLTSHRRWLLLCLLQDEGKKVNIDDWDLGTMGCPPMAPGSIKDVMLPRSETAHLEQTDSFTIKATPSVMT